ncbi:hypothetical protein [Halosimplex sp. TS25]|uniref:hypothetical protein n=1 Tax=Halosimplex rarum TaxID=3396619 RepID=UPI0039E7F1C7
MARLTIELPSELRFEGKAATERAAGTENGYRADGVGAATEAFVDWVGCWAGA